MSTSSRTPSRWNGLSTEERQRERRQLLIESAFELLANEGSNATTVRAVCAHARLNPRYFYESFDGLDDLVVAVFDKVVGELRDQVTAAVRSVSTDAPDHVQSAVRATVEATVHFVDEDRRRGRVLYVEAMGNEALNVHRMETSFGLVELVQRDTARRRGARGSEPVDRLSAAMLVGGFSEILVAWLDERIDMTPTELIDAATALFVAVGEAAAAHASV